MEPVATRVLHLLPENQVVFSLPLPAPHLPSVGDSLWGQRFPESTSLSVEFPLACLAELAPLNSGASLACSGGLCAGLRR